MIARFVTSEDEQRTVRLQITVDEDGDACVSAEVSDLEETIPILWVLRSGSKKACDLSLIDLTSLPAAGFVILRDKVEVPR